MRRAKEEGSSKSASSTGRGGQRELGSEDGLKLLSRLRRLSYQETWMNKNSRGELCRSKERLKRELIPMRQRNSLTK
jgi:hypothetical protein